MTTLPLPIRATQPTRRKVFDRDGGACTTCGFSPTISNPLIAITVEDDPSPQPNDPYSFRAVCLECASLGTDHPNGDGDYFPCQSAEFVTTWNEAWSSFSYAGSIEPRDKNWASSLDTMLKKGASPIQLVNVIPVPMGKRLSHGSRWKYFCGCIHNSLPDQLVAARDVEVLPSLPLRLGDSAEAMVAISHEFRICIECLAEARDDDYSYTSRAEWALYGSKRVGLNARVHVPICNTHRDYILSGEAWLHDGTPSDARIERLSNR